MKWNVTDELARNWDSFRCVMRGAFHDESDTSWWEHRLMMRATPHDESEGLYWWIAVSAAELISVWAHLPSHILCTLLYMWVFCFVLYICWWQISDLIVCTNIDSVTERSLRPEFRKLVREPLEIALERLQRHRDLKQGKCQIFIWNFTMCSICFLFMKAQWPVSYSRAVKYRLMQTHISLGLHGPPSYYHYHHVPCKMA